MQHYLIKQWHVFNVKGSEMRCLPSKEWPKNKIIYIERHWLGGDGTSPKHWFAWIAANQQDQEHSIYLGLNDWQIVPIFGNK